MTKNSHEMKGRNFEQLASDMDKPPKSLHRMLSAAGNPTLSHVSAMLAAIAAHLGVEIQTKVKLM
jgi:DNA-binding phage protein